jgi:hypothetical protein
MSMQLQVRVTTLENEVKVLRELVTGLIQSIEEGQPKKETLHLNPNGPRQMCPKCGVKPAYHLHVVNCKGPWQGNGAAP